MTKETNTKIVKREREREKERKNKTHAASTLHINKNVRLLIWDHKYVIIFIKIFSTKGKPDWNGKQCSVGDSGMSRFYSTMNENFQENEAVNCLSPPLSLSDGHMMSHCWLCVRFHIAQFVMQRNDVETLSTCAWTQLRPLFSFLSIQYPDVQRLLFEISNYNMSINGGMNIENTQQDRSNIVSIKNYTNLFS